MQRLSWWSRRIGHVELHILSDDEIHAALEDLAQQRSRYFAGNDVDNKPIYRDKRKPIAPATVNRYSASLAAVLTWAIKRRIASKGSLVQGTGSRVAKGSLTKRTVGSLLVGPGQEDREPIGPTRSLSIRGLSRRALAADARCVG